MRRTNHDDQSLREAGAAADPGPDVQGLPVFRGALLGREEESRRLVAAMQSRRLVTLMGPGGIGKTRLAAETARVAAPDFPDGVVWVDLVPLRDSALVVAAAASAMGVEEERNRSLLDSLTANLLYQRRLLVLDNCEHVVDGVRPLVARLLSDCPEVVVMCTSRQVLGLPGEQRIDVSPLPADSAAGPVGSPAVRLFVERAADVRPGFRLTEQGANRVADMCRRLDGIPLAIELAAARTAVLGVADIADRLDRRFDLLRASSPDDARHQTLRAVFDWSYELLDEAEQRLFDRLGPFAGGFTIDAAEAVCSGAPLGRSEVVEVLGRLIDRSLVAVGQHGERARFHRMDTLRIYASERLATSPDEAAVRRRHALWFLETLRRAAGTGLHELAALEVEADNFRSALTWALDHDLDLAAELVAALSPLWESQGHLVEGRQWVQRVLARAEGANVAALATLLEAAGTLATAQADYAAADEHLRQAHALLGADDTGALARVETKLGVIARYEGRMAEAETLLSQALERQRQASDRRSAAATLVELGQVAALRGDRDTARLLYGQAASLSGQSGDQVGTARASVLLGELAARNSDVAIARLHYDEAAEAFRHAGDRRGLAAVLTALGRLSILQDDLPAAREHHDRALELYEEMHDRRGQANALAGLAFAAYMVGDHAGSEALFRRAMAVRRSMGDRRGLAVAMVGVANALFLRVDPPPDLAAAKELAEEALAVQTEIGDKVNAAWTTYSLAEIARDLGLHEQARRQAQASIELHAATGQAYNGIAHASLAAVIVAEGDPGGAAGLAAEALALARKSGIGLQITRCVELIARICCARGELEAATQLYAAADAARRSVSPRMPERVGQQRVLDADMTVISRDLAPDEVRALRAVGEAMTLDEAADVAARLCGPPGAAVDLPRQRPASSPPTVTVLGGFAVGDTPGASAGGAPAQLVKLLAVMGPVHRDEVVEYLWADAEPGVGRRRLHNVAARVRKAFGDVMSREGEILRINSEYQVDALVFAAAAREALALAEAGSPEAGPALDRALDLYTGELLPDDRYEEWAVSARERALQLLLRLLHAAARHREQAGDIAGAVEALERAIEHDHLDEGHYVAAARLLIRAGWRDRARQLVRAARTVDTELGLRPSEELRRIEEVLDHRA